MTGGKPMFDLTKSGFNNIGKNDAERASRAAGANYGVSGITPMNESSRGFNQFIGGAGGAASSMVSQSPLNAGGKFSTRFK